MPTAANSINSTVGASVSGVTNTLTVTNASNTASSQAQVNCVVGGTTSGDAWHQFTVGTTQNYALGISNSNSQSLRLTGAASGTGTPSSGTLLMAVTSAGAVTFPAKPAFGAFLSAGNTNVSGNGNVFTIGSGTAFTEIFDQGNNFNTNGTFTAPVTGRYFFEVTVGMGNLSVAMTLGSINCVTSNRTSNIGVMNPGVSQTSTLLYLNGSILTDMDAADVSNFTLTITGAAGNTASLVGGGSPVVTYMSGF